MELKSFFHPTFTQDQAMELHQLPVSTDAIYCFSIWSIPLPINSTLSLLHFILSILLWGTAPFELNLLLHRELCLLPDLPKAEARQSGQQRGSLAYTEM